MLLDLWPLLEEEAAPEVTGGYHPTTRYELRARTRLRYTLRITIGGAVEHHDPEPILVRSAVTVLVGAHHGSRHEHRLAQTIGRAGVTLRQRDHVCLASTHLRIDDPDEWVIFDDPAFS